jgi:prepilin-type N-terminal cleavage/methylation domain-containing protein
VTIRRMTIRGFTLIETMLAVLLLALLASGAALSFSRPIQASRARQAIDEVCAADHAARLDAMRADRAVRLLIDSNANSIRLYEHEQLRSQTKLAGSSRIDRILIGQRLIRDGSASVDFSGSGYSNSYAVHTSNTWIIFHGLTGEMTLTTDEQTARSILNPQSN